MLEIIAVALLASLATVTAVPQSAHAQEGKPVTTTQNTTPDATTATKPAPATKPVPTKTVRIPLNGVTYYYEVHGEGEPLLLLHGGLGLIEMFGPVLPMLAANRQVIAVDLHGHGRTPLGGRPLTMEAVSDDMAALVKSLGHTQVDVVGYSFGGLLALRMAIQHPQTVRRLVVGSAPFARDGFYPDLLAQQALVNSGMAEAMKSTPMYASYAAVAPDVSEFPKLLDAMGALMARPYDWSAEVKTLPMPVMLVFGDGDMFRPEHIIQFYQLLGGGLRDAGWTREAMPKSRLAILPDFTHYEMFSAPAFAETILPFLNGKSGAKSWAEQVRK